MKIVHVVRQFHPAIGGLESVVHALATAQIAKGHVVRVVTLNRVFNAPQSERLADAERFEGIDIVRIPYVGSTRYPIAPSVIRHIRDADIVHVHGIDFFFDYLAWTRPIHRRKLVGSTHGGFFHTPFAARLKRLYFHTVTRLSLRWYAGVAAVSTADDRLFRTIRSQGICLVENGVDVDKYAGAAARTPRKSLVTVGRLSSNKRLDRVIHFLAALRRIDPQWTLTIAGRPFDVAVADLRTVADEAGVSEQVEIFDTPSDERIRHVIANGSVMVSASAYEGFGLAVVEGLSAGLWPLVSPIPPFRHLVEKVGLGTVVDFDDIDAAVWDFLADWKTVEADYSRTRRAAIEAAASFRWTAASEKYEALYDLVLGKQARTILDVPVLVKTSAEAVDFLDDHYDTGSPVTVVFANAHTLNTTAVDRRVRSILDNSIVFNDGIGVDIASRLLFGKSFPENLNGTDFVPHYLRNTKHRYRIFLLGAQPGVAATAAERLQAIAPGHDVVGHCHGYVPRERVAEVIEQIRRARADILLVAMGNPHQEAWLDDYLKETGCKLGFGVGGLFDFIAGVVPRAPRWVQTARIEWAFRMMQQPRRLWRRYLIEMPVFLARVFRQWILGARVPTATPR